MYTQSTIHVFDTRNIVADWDETIQCTYDNCSLALTDTQTLTRGQIYASVGSKICIARVKKNVSYIVFNGRPSSSTSLFYYSEKPNTTNSLDVRILVDGEPISQNPRQGVKFIAREDGWVAFRSKAVGDTINYTPIIAVSDESVPEEDRDKFPSPKEITYTKVFENPVEGNRVNDKEYTNYDWVKGILTDGEHFYNEGTPYVPFMLTGRYYIYFDEGTADVSYLTWNQEDRLYRFMLSQEDRIPVLTDNDEQPIAGIVLEPETGFDERETPIENPNLERKE